jgi:hypothetical protein
MCSLKLPSQKIAVAVGALSVPKAQPMALSAVALVIGLAALAAANDCASSVVSRFSDRCHGAVWPSRHVPGL